MDIILHYLIEHKNQGSQNNVVLIRFRGSQEVEFGEHRIRGWSVEVAMDPPGALHLCKPRSGYD